MKLTKSNLKQMILQEIKVSIGSFLEEADLGAPDEDIGSGNTATRANIGSQDDGEEGGMASIAEVSEESPEYVFDKFIADLETLAEFFGVGSEEMETLDPIIDDFKVQNPNPGNAVAQYKAGWQKQ